MWKTDNNSELNKLYKDIKINKYISELSDEDEDGSENENNKIIVDLKNFIYGIVLPYFERNDSISALYYFGPGDGESITTCFYNFLYYTC